MSESVVIDRRFRGPPESGQGGYACGLLAERVPGECAAVSLRRPPPLEHALRLDRRDDGSAAMLDGDALVAECEPADLRLDVPAPVSVELARCAVLESEWQEKHPFPGCFGCGPERSQEEAVAITMGPLEPGALYAGTWTPLEEFTRESDRVAPLFVWSALDCPTAAAAVPLDSRASVLARLTARLLVPPVARSEHIVLAWLIGHDGRKHLGGSAIYRPDGELCAYAEGLWIELRDPGSMGVKT